VVFSRELELAAQLYFPGEGLLFASVQQLRLFGRSAQRYKLFCSRRVKARCEFVAPAPSKG
jgi:hypothetical protein